jgi:hypothetical protein
MAGRHTKCTRCGNVFPVPAASVEERDWRKSPPQSTEIPHEQTASEPINSEQPVVETSAFSDLTFAPAAPYRGGQPRRSLMLAAITVLGVLLICLCAIILAVWTSQRKSAESPSGAAAPALGKKDAKGLADELADLSRTALTTAVGLAILVAGIAYVLFVFGMMVWVATDARNRGMESALWGIIYIVPQLATIWSLPFGVLVPVFGWVYLLVALPFSWSGLCVYVLARRSGRLVQCSYCPNNRLDYVRTCPHCGR